MCGVTYGNTYSNSDRALNNLTDAIFRITVNNQPSIPMMESHRCDDLRGGIADLIGYVLQ